MKFRQPSERAMLMICISIAFLFWLGLKLSKTYRTNLTYTIEYVLPNGKTFAKKPSNQVEIKLEGEGWDLMVNNLFKNQNEKINYSLTENPQQFVNETNIKNKVKQLLPPDINILEINLPETSIALEKMDQKKVPIRLVTSTDIGMGYQLSPETQIMPDSVIITGPISLVDSINEWNTKRIVIKEYPTSSFKKIALAPSTSDAVRTDLKSVKVKLEMEQMTEKIFQLPIKFKPSQGTNTDNEIITIPSFVTVKAKVLAKNYDKITEKDLELFCESMLQPNDSIDTKAIIKITSKNSAIAQFWYYPQQVQYFYKL